MRVFHHNLEYIYLNTLFSDSVKINAIRSLEDESFLTRDGVLNDLRGVTSEGGHVGTETIRSGSIANFVEQGKSSFVYCSGDVSVSGPRKLGKLMEVGCEENERVGYILQMFGDRPSKPEPVLGGSSAT